MALIEREALLDIAEQQGHVTVDDILSADTIDAAPVVHGRWIRQGVFEVYMCSVCGEYHGDTNYCPGCGTRMDLPEGEEERDDAD